MTERLHEHTVFLQLLGSRKHREVNLSKVFAACFQDSTAFRRGVVDLLSRTCRGKFSADATWICKAEESLGDAGRADLRVFQSSDPNGLHFQLESKVGAPLTHAQLQKYRRVKGAKYLVAVTKHRPEVRSHWMHERGIYALRWQEFHRAIAAVSAKGRDAYICKSFCRYLEELGMAHREDISVKDLDELQRLFFKIGLQKKGEVNPGKAFQVGEACLALLTDVMDDAVERAPQLAKWQRFGPSYSKGAYDDDDGTLWHYLKFEFHRDSWRQSLGAGVAFNPKRNGKCSWEVGGTTKAHSGWWDWELSEICDSGVLDRERMLKSFLSVARSHGIRC